MKIKKNDMLQQDYMSRFFFNAHYILSKNLISFDNLRFELVH